MNNIAKDVLLKDVLLNVDMLECIRRKSADIIFTSKTGVLIRDIVSNIYMMYAEDIETAKAIVKSISQDIDIIETHQEFYNNVLKERFNFKKKIVCNNLVYMSAKPINILSDYVEIRLLGHEHKDFIIKNYSEKSLCNEEYICGRLDAKAIYGAFVKNELCGFVGKHEEGSIGMLEVTPKFRRMGIASRLVARVVNETLVYGGYPYGQAKEGNEASIKLNKRLEFKICPNKVYWLFK